MAHPLIDSDVYRRIGGQQALSQLLDPNGTGSWDTSTLDTAMQDGWNFVIAAVGVQADIVGLTNEQLREQYPDYITLGAQKTLKFAWVYGTRGQACPDKVNELDKLADQQLQLLAERRRKHGAQNTDAGAAQRITRIDIDPGNTRMTLSSFKGFI